MAIEKVILTKDTAKKIMAETKGEARGFCLKQDMTTLLKEKGKEGLVLLEKEWSELGYDVKYYKIKTGEFYPLGMDLINVLLIWKIFDFNDDKIRKIGYESIKASFFIRVVLKYFFSLPQTLKEASKMWHHHYTVGELRSEVDEEKKEIIGQVHNFSLHPIFCVALEGFFEGACRLMIKDKRVTCKETKCTFRGDDCHEFVIKWGDQTQK